MEIITSKDKTYRAEYIIDADAGGMKSILAQKFNWRYRDLMSRSRTIFTHMIDVPGFNEVTMPHQEFGHPYPLSQGTLHHIFKAWLAGKKAHDSHGDDTSQLGGDFIVDRNGILRLVYPSHDPADRPPVDKLLNILKAL